MRVLEILIQKIDDNRRKMTELKLWLAQKEVVEYNAWKVENPKDRTAMEKVIATLKLNDENWLEKEQEYIKVSNDFTYYKNIYDVVLKLLDREDITKEEIEDFIADLV